jgi:two-component system, NtrC family, response regulator GlrR
MSAGPSRSAPRAATTLLSVAGKPVAVKLREIQLEVTGGPDEGTGARLAKRELSVGTDPANDLVLTDPTASRFHFRVRADEVGYRVIDAGSTNGTRVNGVRVRDGFVDDGARIEIGRTAMAVRFRGGETEIELSADEQFGGAVGRSVAMREVFAQARRAARTPSTVLLVGETGTGKDVLARAIHDASPRASAPFVVFDCGAAAETLIESELFGHVKGAFTGAEGDRAGVFERASGGTLFIDEIGELPPALQPKLLRAIENRVVTPVGATSEVPVDVRIIAATHRDLRSMIAEDHFRSDLYFRLAIVTLEIPPLRERPDDIPLIAGALLDAIIGEQRGGGDAAGLRPYFDDAFGALARRPWPGNVRELRNAIERAVALADPGELAKGGLAGLVEIRTRLAQGPAARLPLESARAQFDRDYLRELMTAAGGDVGRAADLAQVHPKSLARLLRRYGVQRA